MNCPQCGTDMKDDTACPECGRSATSYTAINPSEPETRECAQTHRTVQQAAGETSVPEHMPDNMILAVFAAFFFPYVGVFAVIHAAKVKQLIRKGESEKAWKASMTARRLAIMGLVGAGVQSVLAVVILVMFR